MAIWLSGEGPFTMFSRGPSQGLVNGGRETDFSCKVHNLTG